jgi:hypothetical protein
MGGVSPVGLKFGDELALMCHLPLSIRNLLLTFGQTFLKGRLVHVGASHHLASLAQQHVPDLSRSRDTSCCPRS